MKPVLTKAIRLCGMAFLFSGSVACAQAPIIDLGDSHGQRRTGSAPAQESAAATVGAGEFLQQLQMLQQEVMMLRGEVERQGHELQQLRQQSLDRYIELDRRMGGSGADPDAGASSTIPEARSGGSPVARTAGAPSTNVAQPGEYEAYKNAYAKVKAQEFGGAVTAFQSFLDKYPEGRYAANAHYWLGELYLVLSPPQPEQAMQEFSGLLQNYPDNAKVPDAMLKLGRLYFQRGERDRSRQMLERLVAEYRPQDSSAVSLAQQFLKENF